MTTEDRVALRELVERYALGIDRRESDVVAGLFVEDGVIVVPGVPKSLEPSVETCGREAIARAIAMVDRFVATMHAVVGHVVDIDGDRAGGVVTCLAHHVREDMIDWVWALHYHDTYVREAGTWRFERRELWVDWVEERPVSATR